MLLYNKHIYIFDLIELMHDIRVTTKDDINYEKYLEGLILDTLINTFGFIINNHLETEALILLLSRHLKICRISL